MTFRGDRAIEDEQFPGLRLTPTQIFQQAGLTETDRAVQ